MLSALDTTHPEWRPLLRVIEQMLGEAERSQWARLVPELAHHGQDGRPLLDGAVVRVDPGLIVRWVRRLVKVAATVGTDAEPVARAMRGGQFDPVVAFEIALSQDGHRLDALARSVNDGHGVVRGLAPLIAGPLLHACRSAWAEWVPAHWPYGHCPLCGSWPALAEVRGLDGSRHLRCGGCGGDWRSQWLHCPFCGETDHERLASLIVPDRPEQTIAVCDGCRGYVKTVATLVSIPAAHVVLHDLATLVLDVNAIERDYRRPAAKGRGVTVRVAAEPSWLRELFGRRW
jgi:FdhE protein